MGRRIKAFKQRLFYNIKRPEMRILPGQLAFFFILTLVPLIALIGIIANNLKVDNLLFSNMLMGNFPKSVINFLKGIVVTKKVGKEAAFFFLSALLLASKGTHSIIVASNQIYKVKDNYYIRRVVKSIFMLFVLMFLLTFVLLVPVFGNFIIDFLIRLGIDAKNDFIKIYELIKFPLSFIVIFMAIKLLYTMAPDKALPSKEVNYGALFTTGTWLVFTQLYSLYLKLFPNYSTIYGGISGLIVLMWWIYFLAYLFVLGMALNVSKYSGGDLFEK